MIGYTLLIGLMIIVLIAIMRASKHERRGQRRQREPQLGISSQDEVHVNEVQLVHEPVVQVVQPPQVEQSVIDAVDEPLPSQPSVVEMKAEAEAEPQSEPIDFVIIHLLTDGKRPYKGYELLQALLASGLRYGKKGIFNRHEELTGKGTILFSLAQAVEPGVFDLPKMGSLSTPGLTLFMVVAQVQNPSQTFDLMLRTAKDLQKELGGSLYDEKRKLLTAEKIQHVRACLQNANFATNS